MAEPTSDSASPIAEISHGPSAFERFLDRNQKSMILLALVIALGAGAWVVYSGMGEGKRLTAGQALVDADDVAAMQEVAENHPGTPAAASAAVLLSDMQWDEGQQSAALETLQAEIDANPEHPATIPARARLASRRLQQGDVEGAKAGFQDLIDRPGASYLAPYALMSLSEIARDQGDVEEAQELLERASENYPDNPLRSITTQAATYVDFEMPEAIDPPEPEPLEETDTTLPDGPEPDLSQPLELDPTAPGAGSGNPLLDNLTGAGAGGEDTGEEAAPGTDAGTEDSPLEEPADAGAEPAEGEAEESAPASGE